MFEWLYLFKMLRLPSFILCSFIALSLQGSLADLQSNCLLNDQSTQCVKFWLAKLHPMIDLIPEINTKLDRIQRKQQVIQTKLLEMNFRLKDQRFITKEEFDRKLKLGLKELQSMVDGEIQALQTKFQTMLTLIRGPNFENILPKWEIIKNNIMNQESLIFERIDMRYFYIENNIRKSWIEAASTCIRMGGYLASIKDEEELHAITAKLKPGLNYWLGINDRKVEGSFVSAATGNDAPFLKWKQREPSNTDGIEHCVVLHNGEMNDSMCSYSTYFICQSDKQI